MGKIKNLIVSVGFFLILIIVFFLNRFSEDVKISEAERRTLAQFPKFSVKDIFSGDFFEEFDKYTVDQFIARDSFRGIKKFYNTKILMQKDNNNLFEKDGYIYSIEYPVNEKAVELSSQKIKKIYEKHLNGMNVYYSIIPEKNYYLENDDHLKLENEKFEKILKENLSDLKYIDIKDCLKLEDFYKTDLHWKQENLTNVVEKIQNEIGLERNNIKYRKINSGKFLGAYYGQLVTNIEPDNLYYLTNDVLDNAITYNYEKDSFGEVYEESKTSDKYDLFLSGAVSLIKIENKSSKTDKELILFRDSFGSSIAPLLLENYKTITLVDLRYISSNILEKYIEFKNQDVLFLYSTLILNKNVFK